MLELESNGILDALDAVDESASPSSSSRKPNSSKDVEKRVEEEEEDVDELVDELEDDGPGIENVHAFKGPQKAKDVDEVHGGETLTNPTRPPLRETNVTNRWSSSPPVASSPIPMEDRIAARKEIIDSLLNSPTFGRRSLSIEPDGFDDGDYYYAPPRDRSPGASASPELNPLMDQDLELDSEDSVYELQFDLVGKSAQDHRRDGLDKAAPVKSPQATKPTSSFKQKPTKHHDSGIDDLLELQEQIERESRRQPKQIPQSRGYSGADDFPEDDLDALLDLEEEMQMDEPAPDYQRPARGDVRRKGTNQNSRDNMQEVDEDFSWLDQEDEFGNGGGAAAAKKTTFAVPPTKPSRPDKFLPPRDLDVLGFEIDTEPLEAARQKEKELELEFRPARRGPKDLLPPNQLLPREEEEPDLEAFEPRRNRAHRMTTVARDLYPGVGGAGETDSRMKGRSYVREDFLSGNRDERGIPKYLPSSSVRAISFDGEPISFLRRRRMRGWKLPKAHAGDSLEDLLARPIHHMIDEIEMRQTEEAMEKSAKEAARAERNMSEDEDDGVGGNAGPSTEKPGKAMDTRLWVDHYRPQRYPELLGDERVHREMLGWIKQWDQCVFKRAPPKTARASKYGNKWSAAAFDDAPAYRDAYGRPQEKLLLVSGPPGIGKTTLAHVLAKQAGYGVYELNASDARNAAAVEDLVRNALESASLKDPRPTLVIIDEIDGATGGGSGGSDGPQGGGGGGFIRALVKLIQDGISTKGAKGGKGKKAKAKPVLRPIICICNDLYASALRPLRPLAKLIRLQNVPTPLLVNRLRLICQKEELKADTRSLTLLAELTGGDIRSCINALQFVKTRTNELTSEVVKSAALGIKDGSTSLNQVWHMIFRTPDARSKARGGAPRDDFEAVQKIVHEAQLCSEYERLAQGCFELYPSLRRLKDDGWHRYEKVHDWLHFGQTVLDSVYKMQTYELMAFMPWTFVPWYHQFANLHNVLPEYPRADYEAYLRRTAFQESASTLHVALPPLTRCHFNIESLTMELGPLLTRILAPEIRPINTVVKPDDKVLLDAAVQIMLHLGLRFVHDKTPEGQLVFRVDPPLDSFVQYASSSSATLPSGVASAASAGGSKSAVRHLIAKEIDKEILRARTQEESLALAAAGKDPSSTAHNALAAYRKTGAATVTEASKKKKEKVAVDFFGRPIVKKPTSTTATSTGSLPLLPGSRAWKAAQEAAANSTASAGATEGQEATDTDASQLATPVEEARQPEKPSVKVFYRYHEGYSNAVRRPVRMSDLL